MRISPPRRIDRGPRTIIPPIYALLLISALALSLAACLGGIVETPSPAPDSGQGAGPSPTLDVVAPTQTGLPAPIQSELTSTASPEPPTTTPLPPAPATRPPTEPPDTPAPAPSVAEFPDPDAFGWSPVAGGLDRPVDLTHAGDGSGRMFVLEQAGRVRILRDGALLADPFLDIRDRVGSGASEQGLLGIAFHPRYDENGFFYLNYTDLSGDTVIARYQVAGDPDRADPQSEARLLQVGQPYRNHNGGGLAFGPDGYLYIALGDGGSAGDPQGNGQSTSALLGKILRIDVDAGDPYGIPPDNPFVAGGGRPEVWAYGLRNPWRLSFDRLTGDLYTGDVGQNVWEEIDYQAAGTAGGLNFGWNFREGFHPFAGSPPPGADLVEPVAEYDHSLGCSVTGGFVYRGEALPEWQGVYLYGDYCSGRVWGLLRGPDGVWQHNQVFSTGERIASFGEDEGGELYLAGYGGTIYQLVRR